MVTIAGPGYGLANEANSAPTTMEITSTGCHFADQRRRNIAVCIDRNHVDRQSLGLARRNWRTGSRGERSHALGPGMHVHLRSIVPAVAAWKKETIFRDEIQTALRNEFAPAGRPASISAPLPSSG